jgi:hypothetical protein
MEQLTGLPTSRKLILGAGALLFVDSFFAWQKVEVKIAGVTAVSAKANAWHGFWGVLLCLMTIVLVAWVAARAFGVALPANVPDGLAILALGVLIFVFAVLKNLADDYAARARVVGIILAAVIAVGSWLAFQESGETLPKMPTTQDRDASSTPPAAHEPPEAPASTDPH